MAGIAVRSKTIGTAKSFSTIKDSEIVNNSRYILSVTVTEEERIVEGGRQKVREEFCSNSKLNRPK